VKRFLITTVVTVMTVGLSHSPSDRRSALRIVLDNCIYALITEKGTTVSRWSASRARSPRHALVVLALPLKEIYDSIIPLFPLSLTQDVPPTEEMHGAFLR
jgi:hypothetical protein